MVNRIFTYTVLPAELPCSLGEYLRRRGYSQSLLAAFRHRDGVTVNGGFHRQIDPLAAGDVIAVEAVDQSSVLQPNLALTLPILYEDDDLLLLHKPDDMLVHPAGPGFDDAVGNFFAAYCPGLTFRPIGRLDRHTTGICLLAKNRLTAACLTENPPQKRYFALAEGLFAEAQGRIEAPLLRQPGPLISRRVAEGGQPSITNYRVLAQGGRHSLLELRLETGRTHQIRVHLQYIGHPLAGDAMYGGGSTLLQRQALHLGWLRFCHPQTSLLHTIKTPLPGDMLRAMALAGVDGEAYEAACSALSASSGCAAS